MITICCGFIFLLWNIIVPSIKVRWTLYGTEHLWNQSLTWPESQHSSFEKLSGKLLLTNSFIFTKLQERSLIDIHVYGKVTKHKLEKKHTYKMFIDNKSVKKEVISSKVPVTIQDTCCNPPSVLSISLRFDANAYRYVQMTRCTRWKPNSICISSWWQSGLLTNVIKLLMWKLSILTWQRRSDIVFGLIFSQPVKKHTCLLVKHSYQDTESYFRP